MSMQTDVQASAVLTADGQLLDQAGGTITRARIKSIYIVPSGTAGSVVFKDGGASGTTRLTINTLAALWLWSLQVTARGSVVLSTAFGSQARPLGDR